MAWAAGQLLNFLYLFGFSSHVPGHQDKARYEYAQ